MSGQEYIQMSKLTRVVSDRDIKKKSRFGNYLDVDIKKGQPFYPSEVFQSTPWRKQGTVEIDCSEYPIEWFSLYDPEYEQWVTEAQKYVSGTFRSKLGKLYYALKSGELKAPEVE